MRSEFAWSFSWVSVMLSAHRFPVEFAGALHNYRSWLTVGMHVPFLGSGRWWEDFR